MEMSGDLTLVMGEMQQIPDWFQSEKIHRFNGPDEGVRLYRGSQPLSQSSNFRIPNSAQVSTPPPNASQKEQGYSGKTQDNNTKKMHQSANSGCGLLLFILGMALCFGATAIPLLT